MENKICDILITNVSYLDENIQVKKADCIVIKDGIISHIGKNFGWTSKEVFNGNGLLWMPGLVDGHTHTSQQLLRGRLLDEKPVIWKRINVPFEASLTEETSELSASLCALEMIRSGTTGFIDAGGKYVKNFAKVYNASRLRGRLSYMTNDNPSMPDALRIDIQSALKSQIQLNEELSNGLLKGIFSVTALTAASEKLIRTIFSYAKENNIATEVHMNEYASEVYDFIEKYGLRPFEWMEKEGLIGDKFTAAHGIFLSPSEIEIILNKKIRIMHCPFSNCGKGIPKTPELLNRGAIVGFGSDGSAHGGVDLFKEMRLFRGVINVHHGILSADPQVMPAAKLIKMATQGGAAALDVEGLGIIKEGSPADIIAINIDAPHLYPTNNLINTMVESACGNDVSHSIVNGNVLMRNRVVETLDEEKIIWTAHELYKN